MCDGFESAEFYQVCVVGGGGECGGDTAVWRVECAGAGASSYKALVCVFLFGGNDANNTLIPFDTTGYGNYSTIRGPLAIAQNQLLQLTAAAELRAESESAGHSDAVQQQERGVCGECGDAD